jgi:aryl-alcohol dehydrogenase-like predicted oxidoreductase
MPESNDHTATLGGTARLGESTVARIGFGVMQLERRVPSREAARAILTAAADAGINHFDTAAFYGDCNELIREALGARRDGVVLATKVGAARNAAGDLVPGQTPEELRRQVEENLASLGTDHLEVVNLRRLDHAPGIRAEGDQIVDIDLQLAELEALRDAGTIGAIGLSNVSAQQLEHALPAGIVCVQNHYNVLERDSAPVLESCRQNGVAWVPYFPLGSAFPGREKVTGVPTVQAVAAELGATPAQVALAWLLAEYENTLLITGTSDPAHLAENVATGDLHLPPDALEALNRVASSQKSL